MKLKCLQIDLARQKENLPFIFKYIDFAKSCGYNAMFFYLENSVRTESTPFFDVNETYSQDEMKSIIEYCNKAGIEAIPALQNLGHLEKFFKYKELSPLSELADGITKGRFGTGKDKANCGCVSNPDFYKFFDRYTTEVCSLFDSIYVHMGLDEAFDFAICPKCESKIKNGESKESLFLEHIRHTHSLIKKLGKTMMMWDDFFEYLDVVADIPKEIVLCNWNYGFIGDEPPGHWTNRIKKDWFALYDKLGLKYLFCTAGGCTSITYNSDTFFRYAKRYNPIGAVMTSWEKKDTFYNAQYLSILYFGFLINGKIKSHEDKIALYKSFLELDEDSAMFIASLQVMSFGDNFAPTQCYEEVGLVRLNYVEYLHYVLAMLKDIENKVSVNHKDIITCIYDSTLEIYIGLRLHYLARDIFDGYKAEKPDTKHFISEIDWIRSAYRELQSSGEKLWHKFREGIVSANNYFKKKFIEAFSKLDLIENKVRQEKQRGVFTLECMLNDTCISAKLKVILKYKDGEESLIFDGNAKPNTSSWDLGGNYSFSFATEFKEIESARISVYGEGAIGVANARHYLEKERYSVNRVEHICGRVDFVENIVSEDLRFAYLGNDNGKGHMDNLFLAKTPNTVLIVF